MVKETLCYDVCVIGGGPSGMMSAGFAADAGARVILVEKNSQLGRKLLITGGGRCNVLNATFDSFELSQRYGPKGKALLSLFSEFNAEQAFSFFEENGVPLNVEAEDRAFPRTNEARSIVKCLTSFMKGKGVKLALGECLHQFNFAKAENGLDVLESVTTDKYLIKAKQFILATGGFARPETGSSGECLRYLNERGVKVIFPKPSLVPIYVKEDWPKQLQGLAFPDLTVSVYKGDEKLKQVKGKVLCTHFGLSGPLILNLSQFLQQEKEKSTQQKGGTGEPIVLGLNFMGMDLQECDAFLCDQIQETPRRGVLNLLKNHVPKKLVENILASEKLDPALACGTLTRVQRQGIAKRLIDMRLTFKGLLSLEKAIVSSGGIDLNELNFKTMLLKTTTNLRPLGDMLDFDRPSGGYSLQICWSTAYRAGTLAGWDALA